MNELMARESSKFKLIENFSLFVSDKDKNTKKTQNDKNLWKL